MIDDATLEKLVDANAASLGLTIDPAWRPAVKLNLMALAGAMELVGSFVLPDEADCAPVYEP